MVLFTIFKPSGWNIPVAKRFQLSLSSLSSIPETIQTSPWNVQIAARPSGKKSNPPKNVFAFHGLGKDSERMSDTYGALSALRVPLVMTGSFQRGAPPRVSFARSGNDFVCSKRILKNSQARAGAHAKWPLETIVDGSRRGSAG